MQEIKEYRTAKILRYFTKYIWWQKADEIMLENPLRVL